MICFTVCLFISPDLDGYRASLTLRDPENCKVPIPKYEAAALHVHLSIGYPNSTNGQCAQQYGTSDGEATSASHDNNQRLRQSVT
jgi:hypothetical protein